MYKRILLKVSGEQLAGEHETGIDPNVVAWIASEAKKIVEIHDNATKYVQENPDDSVSQLPKDIVANPDIEKKSLSGINFVSGLDDAYKQKVLDFMNIEVDLGVLQ